MILISLYEANDVVVQFDENSKIFKFSWNSNVSLESIKQLTQNVLKHLTKIELGYFLFDRRFLTSFTPEAVEWLKSDFLKKEEKQLLRKIHRVATIDSAEISKSKKPKLIISKMLSKSNSKMKMKFFTTERAAIQWILQEEEIKELTFWEYLVLVFSMKKQF